MTEADDEFSGKRVFVSGGAGCIGSNLVRKLLGLSVSEVVIIDNLSSSSEWNLPKDRRVNFVKGSILEQEPMRRAFDKPFDYVFHLAAHFANQNSIDHPDTDLL